MKQAEFIGERFIQKGYQHNFIKEKIKDVTALDRKKCIQVFCIQK